MLSRGSAEKLYGGSQMLTHESAERVMRRTPNAQPWVGSGGVGGDPKCSAMGWLRGYMGDPKCSPMGQLRGYEEDPKCSSMGQLRGL